MSIQPISSSRSPARVVKKSETATPISPSRKRESDLAIEDDDWLPVAAKMPARVVSEFIDNDYDMM